MPEQRALEEDQVHPREWEWRDCARAEPRRLLDLLRGGHAGRLGASDPRDLLGISPAITGYERDDRSVAADEDERLHDLIEGAPDGLRSVRCRRCALGELLDANLGSGLAQKDETRSTGSGQAATTAEI